MILPLLLIPAYAQEDSEIPSWVKKNMVFWGDDLLTDNEMVNMLQYLVDADIIKLGENTIQKEIEIVEIQIEPNDNIENDRIIEEFEREIVELENAIENRERVIEDLEDQLTSEVDEVKEIFAKDSIEYEKVIKELRAKLDATNNTSEIDEIKEIYQKEVMQYRNQIYAMEDDIVKKDNTIIQLNSKITQLNNEIADLNYQIENN